MCMCGVEVLCVCVWGGRCCVWGGGVVWVEVLCVEVLCVHVWGVGVKASKPHSYSYYQEF